MMAEERSADMPATDRVPNGRWFIRQGYLIKFTHTYFVRHKSDVEKRDTVGQSMTPNRSRQLRPKSEAFPRPSIHDAALNTCQNLNPRHEFTAGYGAKYGVHSAISVHCVESYRPLDRTLKVSVQIHPFDLGFEGCRCGAAPCECPNRCLR